MRTFVFDPARWTDLVIVAVAAPIAARVHQAEAVARLPDAQVRGGPRRSARPIRVRRSAGRECPTRESQERGR